MGQSVNRHSLKEVKSALNNVRSHFLCVCTEHKVNMTLVNCSLSLLDEEREVMVVTLTHFLASLETRPSAHAYKASLRIESAAVEASNQERDLVPIFTANMPSSK